MSLPNYSFQLFIVKNIFIKNDGVQAVVFVSLKCLDYIKPPHLKQITIKKWEIHDLPSQWKLTGDGKFAECTWAPKGKTSCQDPLSASGFDEVSLFSL